MTTPADAPTIAGLEAEVRRLRATVNELEDVNEGFFIELYHLRVPFNSMFQINHHLSTTLKIFKSY